MPRSGQHDLPAPMALVAARIAERLAGRDGGRFAAEFATGRRNLAANGGIAPPPPDTDVPVSQEVARRQHDIRLSALRRAVPANRWDTRTGLASLDSDQHPNALAAWLADPDALTLVLAGNTGSGKSQAAYAVAVESVLKGAAGRDRKQRPVTREMLVRAWPVNDLIAELLPEGSQDPIWAVRDRARAAELLILDGLGEATYDTASEKTGKELLSLLSWRIEHRLRTVFTTNLGSADLRTRYGPPFMSRMVECATVVQFVGPDRRDLTGLEW